MELRIADEAIIAGKRAIAKSYAKINLTLDVLGKMENGYHEIETVMQTINLFDLVITDREKKGISVSTNLKYLPSNEKNIAYKAAQLFFSETGIKEGAKILIHKNIPVAAGLAGGSGNAAAVLASLNLLYGNILTDERLLEIGAKLGADVPFSMVAGTWLCKGIGDKMSEIPDFPKTYILLVKPPVNVSTAEIYSAIDNEDIGEHPITKDFIDSGYSYDKIFNVMETVTVKKHPVIRGIKEKMLMNGAKAAMMSGSGPTVFGIFDDYQKAKASADSFSYMYKEVFLTTTN